MILLDGRTLSNQIKSEIAQEVKHDFLDQGKTAPHLAAVLVGEDPASQTYVMMPLSGRVPLCCFFPAISPASPPAAKPDAATAADPASG